MDIKITVPDSLSEITLGDYQKFMKISEGKDMDIFIQQKMVQIFCKIPLIAVSKIKINDFKKIVNHLSNVISQKSNFIPTTKVNGKMYGFIPDLDNDMTFGEYVDLDSFIKSWETFDKAMSVLYRPIKVKKGNKYQIKDYDSRNDIAYTREITMDVVTGAIVFFCNLSNALLKATPSYLSKLVHKLPQGNKEKTLMEGINKNGGGTLTFLELLEETSLKLEMLLPQTLAKPYSI